VREVDVVTLEEEFVSLVGEAEVRLVVFIKEVAEIEAVVPWEAVVKVSIAEPLEVAVEVSIVVFLEVVATVKIELHSEGMLKLKDIAFCKVYDCSPDETAATAEARLIIMK
jgi:hypothetical protein